MTEFTEAPNTGVIITKTDDGEIKATIPIGDFVHRTSTVGPAARDTDSETADREMLERLAWVIGFTGQTFWPIGESAQERVEPHEEVYRESEEFDADIELANEYGHDVRAVSEACALFGDLYYNGYDPVQLAEVYIEKTCETGAERAALEVNWDWLQYSTLPDEYVETHVTEFEGSGGETQS